ncbi:MAG: hypothetical protein F4X80_08185 [Chloroflexi bacterium]|nr:hypothetical protein [Chloroflexota bacterium]MXZ63488.1 hypothetical protein [Chloroflexota bacterium]MYE32612.1 hypothetical protein [Chloroflexota bacterium]
MHGLRNEYQDRVNFVILDFDIREDRALAERLGINAHPAYATVGPAADEVVTRFFGPTPERKLREVLDELIASHGS